MNTSIEVEYWVIDRDGELASPESLAASSERAEAEFVNSPLEVKTPPCETMAELRTTFVDRLVELLSRAEAVDRRLVPLGTPINGDVNRLPVERGRIQRDVTGANVDCAKYCAGTRIRVEKRDVTDQLNALVALDPALALVTSSPYQRGERIASSARAHCYRTRSDAAFPRHGRRWGYAEDLNEWYRRLERCVESFEERTLERAEGVDEAAIETDDAVWTPVRLRDATPTVEWRSPDAALPSQLLRLTDDLRTVMETLDHADVRIEQSDDGGPGRVTSEEVTLPRFDTLRELSDAAVRDGLESTAVASYLDRMGFSIDDYHPIATRIDGRKYVTKSDARDLRLEYASRLEEDVEELRDAVARER